jgi:hypothetical protein
VLLRELVDARFDKLCPTLACEIRHLGAAAGGLECPHRRGQDVTVEIDHPAGEEIQWDWLELHHTPWSELAFGGDGTTFFFIGNSRGTFSALVLRGLI